jgi:hypothetical protein
MKSPSFSFLAAGLLLALPACTTDGTEAEGVVAEAAGWRELATPNDRERVREWRKAWVAAVARAETAGHGAEIREWGPLLEPDAALGQVAPPPGDYRCRTIKIGAKSQGMLDYVAYPPFICRIAPGGTEAPLSFTKLTGSQRPVGRLFPENGRRMIFLGTLQLSDEKGVMRYGHDRERDMAGVLERVGEQRWRLAFPSPHFESLLDVIELVPAS